jgi:hypothetical protein
MVGLVGLCPDIVHIQYHGLRREVEERWLWGAVSLLRNIAGLPG